MLANRVFGLITVVVTTACLWPGLAPEVMAQPVSAATATPEASPRLVTAKGAWSPTVTYALDDLVTSRGSTWRSKHAGNIGKVPGATSPSTAADWERFAAGFNPLGPWLSTPTYQPNDLVVYLGSTWRAKITNLNKVPGIGTTYWEQLAAKGAAGATGATGPQGPPGPSSVPTGSTSAPAFSFTGDSDTGIFSPAAGKIALVEDGALFLHNNGASNIALGLTALSSNTTGAKNAALGAGALQSNTTGSYNAALGGAALISNTGSVNTAVGHSALLSNSTGTYNAALGMSALFANTTGSSNIAIGTIAGYYPTAPADSIFIGNQGQAADTTTIKIGTQGTQTTAFMAGISGVTVANSAAVLIDTSTGQLGTISSSRRYKDDIQPMGEVSAALLKLRPVTFRYKKPYTDGSKPIQYGLIAEEVAEVLPDLAVFNADGTPETVAYHLLPSFLLAEYQRQEKVVGQQQKTIASQAEQLTALERRLVSLEARLVTLQATAQHATARID